MIQKKYLAVGAALIIIALVVYYVGVASEDIEPPKKSGIKFYDVRLQAPEFISYYDSITLTPEQEKIKSDALSSIPAPCCDDYSMLTCCCPCILSKTIWGLSNFLIVEHGYNADQLKDAISRWVSFTNKNGYAGDACYVGRCGLQFEEDGCGGMEKLVLGAGN